MKSYSVEMLPIKLSLFLLLLLLLVLLLIYLLFIEKGIEQIIE